MTRCTGAFWKRGDKYRNAVIRYFRYFGIGIIPTSNHFFLRVSVSHTDTGFPVFRFGSVSVSITTRTSLVFLRFVVCFMIASVVWSATDVPRCDIPMFDFNVVRDRTSCIWEQKNKHNNILRSRKIVTASQREYERESHNWRIVYTNVPAGVLSKYLVD